MSKTAVEQTKIKRNLFVFLTSHILTILGLVGFFKGKLSVSLYTLLFAFVYGTLGGIGVIAGAHRYWSHRSYKAKTPLQILLITFQTILLQDSVLIWVRDHRVHHKYVETDADPHNAKRGFYFAHLGWLFCKKSDACISKLKLIDVSDLESDPIVMFQHNNYYPLAILLAYVIPTLIPMWLWNESFLVSFIMVNFRIVGGHHNTFLINSAAHMWGFKPYDKGIGASENCLTYMGEAWHNFHHVFPWDYNASEFGNNGLNWATAFIDFFACIGWAYDLKTVPKSYIDRRAARTGDGSRGN